MEDSAFLWGSGSREYRVRGMFSAQRFNKSTMLIHYRKAKAPFRPPPSYSAWDLGIMVYLFMVRREMSPHFDPHSAIKRLNHLVYSTTVTTQDRPPIKLPEESPHDLRKKQRKVSVWFLILQWDHRVWSSTIHETLRFLVWKMDSDTIPSCG